MNNRPLVIGGGKVDGDGFSPTVYRGDSFICGAAIHAGVIKDSQGGCGILRREGEASRFPSSEQNDIDSIAFNSSFPLSYSLRPTTCNYTDVRWVLLAISAVASLLLPKITASPHVAFGIVFAAIFLHVALISDPPDEPAISDFRHVIAAATGKLPIVAIAAVVYHLWIAQTFRPIFKNWRSWVIWVVGFWAGALCNLYEQYLHHIQVFLSIFTAIFAVLQILRLQREGQLGYYLACYYLVAGCLSLIYLGGWLCGLQIHLHHYAWPLLLLPVTSTSNSLAFFYQGLLLGISTNGVARWGFGDLLEAIPATTPGEHHRLVPPIPEPSVINDSQILFEWPSPFDEKNGGGISVLVNDVLRYEGFDDSTITPLRFRWARQPDSGPLYFRFGYIQENRYRGLTYGELTEPAVWDVTDKWLKSAGRD